MKFQSKFMERVPVSVTLRMAEIARRAETQGKKLVHFELGEPDFTTAKNIIDAAHRVMLQGLTHYEPSRGVPPLLEAIAKHEEDFGINVNPNKNIIVVPGSKFAIFALLTATIDPGDEVIIVSPSWPSYTDIVNTVGGRPVPVVLNTSLRLNEEGLKNSVSKKTRLVIINSPNNPTGAVLDMKDLKLLRDLAVDRDFLVMSDEIYKMMTYDGARHVSIASLPDMRDRTIVIDGFSKTYAMTGWRLGYAIGDERIISNMVKIQMNTTTCAVSFVQYAAVEALNGSQDSVHKMLEEYAIRRKIAFKLISEIPGIRCVKPMGAFYLFPDVSSYGKPDTEISESLLERGVSLTPGTPFGLGGKGHIRISYVTRTDHILEGMKCIKEYFESL
ncbi:pyridoxal phosphate-dependent aminotransferase [Candidatus Bathyarchaeota archaeon]|nr:pyridoxal phosphate-dependent aminotransferase [Candidatus Bathyarchaeota archaeon]